MTPQELKNSILQLAIQGKLVEQRPEEGTAEDLYRLIQAEKQVLIKAGKIKKEKPLPEITEDEIPFEIPESWKWVRLNDLCELISDGTHKTPTYVEKGVPFLSVKDISSGYLDFSNTRFISQNEHQSLIQRCKPEKDDILICRIGTLGKAIRIDVEREFSIFVSLGLIKLVNKEIANYVVLAINSGYGFSWIQRVKVGGGTHTFKINLDDLRLMPIPLPPLPEQRRMLEKCYSFASDFDRYEAAWSRLEDFNMRFPGDMQKSILQMAIQGKLVEQRPEEGTGEELYKQIQAEKQALIKAGKIKKEKPLPEIAEDEIPFEIPESWMWVRLSNLALKIVDGTHHSPPNSETGEYLYVTAKNIKDSGVLLDNITYVTREIHKEIFSRCNPAKGDILLIKDGATTGVVTVNNLNQPFSMLSSVALIKIPVEVCAWYLVYVLRSDLFNKIIRTQMKGTGITRITLKQIEPLLIPLPPLAEQKRIVARLEELLPLCEKIKS